MPLLQIGGHRGGNRSVEPMYCEIDDDDMERISKYKWSINTSSSKHTHYAETRTGGKKIHLHRLIMGLGDYKDDKRIINHKDGNGLNNTKQNLEICDTLYNSQSFRRHHNSSIGLVYYDTSMKRIKRWRAVITINKKQHQRRFEKEDDAKQWISDIAMKYRL